MRSLVVTIVLLSCLLVAGLLWWLRGGNVELAQGEAGTVQTATDALVANASPSAAGRTSAGPSATAAAPSAPTTAVAPAAGPTGRLLVKVRNERGDALPSCQVSAREHTATTDHLGEAGFDLIVERTFVAVEPPAGSALAGRSGWQTVCAGATTEVVVVLVAVASTPFWCRLVAAEDGRALADAEVREQPVGRSLRSDGEGCVQVLPANDRSFLDVAVAGRAPCRIAPTAGHATREQALRVLVAAGVSLQVQMADAAGGPVAGATLELRAPSFALQQPDLQGVRGADFEWRGTSDAAGSLVLADLPIQVPLAVTVLAPPPYAPPPPERWVIGAGEERRTLTLPGAGRVCGRVVDAGGAVVADAVVQAHPATDAVVPRVLPVAREPRQTKSGDDGTFEIAGLAAGRYWVGLGTSGAQAPVVNVVEVPIGGSVEVELRTRAGLAVAGVALLPDGSPCPGVDVELHLDERFVAGVATDGAGRFRFASLPPGTCELRTGDFVGDLGLPAPQRVEAGDEKVELRLVAVAGSISGRCAGGDDAWVTAWHRGGDGVFGTRCDLDGSFRYPGLRAGTWDVSAFDRRGNVAWSAAIPVLPGRPTAGVVLALQPGAVLRPRHARACEFVVQRGLDVVAIDNLEPNVPGQAPVPAGRWTVVFRARGHELGRRDVTVWAGDDVVVDGGS